MKIHLIETNDSGVRKLVARFDRDAALEVASNWLKGRASSAFESWYNECMDDLSEGKKVQLANLDSIELLQSEIDLSGVVEVLEDARHTMTRNQALLDTLHQKFGSNTNIMEGYDKAKSRYVATEQAVNLTIIKLGG